MSAVTILKKMHIGDAYRNALTLGPAGIITTIKNSGLRGRGGAGFPTGLKWELASKESGEKYIVINADEGEVGAFKDRLLLTEYIENLMEGIAIAGLAIGAKKGYLYLRWEYHFMQENIEQAIKSTNEVYDGLDIELRFGAGAYVCGEESALLDSLEGNRGEPRNKPPYPVTSGLFNSPTVVNNVETLCCVPIIITEGAEHFASVGTEKSKGPKLFSVSGDVAKPGVYEFPLGTKLSEVLAMAGAIDPEIALIGGASGRVVHAVGSLDRPLAYEALPPGGSIVVARYGRNIFDLLENIMEFFVEESCAQCVPCREGTKRLLNFIKRLKHGETVTARELGRYKELGETMQVASKCGLGQSASNAFVSAMDNMGPTIVKNLITQL